MLSPVSRYTRGLFAPFRGLGHLRRNKVLWLWAIPPALVNTLITLLALTLLVWLSWLAVGYVWQLYGSGFWQWVWRIAASIAAVIGVIGATLVVWLMLVNICAGYLLGILAEKVEKRLGLGQDEVYALSLVRETGDAVVESGKMLTIHGVALLMQFVPVIGAVVALPAVLIADAYLFGSEFFSYPMGVRGKTFKERSAFIRAHRAETLGIGTTILPVTLIPIVGGFMMSFATVGAVLLYREILAEQASTDSAAIDSDQPVST